MPTKKTPARNTKTAALDARIGSGSFIMTAYGLVKREHIAPMLAEEADRLRKQDPIETMFV